MTKAEEAIEKLAKMARESGMNPKTMLSPQKAKKGYKTAKDNFWTINRNELIAEMLRSKEITK